MPAIVLKNFDSISSLQKKEKPGYRSGFPSTSCLGDFVIKKSLLFLSFFSTIHAETFEQFQHQQMQEQESNTKEFSKYKKSEEDAFSVYQKAQLKALDDYKKSTLMLLVAFTSIKKSVK